jgi:type II secretory ATPase GspE/PulE/Tfp pilus assembly ATPase PilB-like protein
VSARAGDDGFGDTLLGFTDLSQFDVDPAAARLLPAPLCMELNVVPLGRIPADPGAELTVGMVDPKDDRLVAELRGRLGRPVRPLQLSFFDVRRAIARLHRPSGDDAAPADDLRLVDEEAALTITRRIEFDPDQSPSKMLDDLLSAAIRCRATDIHIETYEGDVDLRFRVDGVLYMITTPLTPESVVRVVSRIRVLCELDVTEKRRSQDGRFHANYRDGRQTRRVDFRVSIVPGPHGLDAVIRILDPKRFKLELDEIMPPGVARARYEQIASYPSGLLLVTGPTGSGKTSTLYATVNRLRGSELKILTVEDPVEYEFPKVNQKNVTEAMGFADYLRAFLRQDPDIILVGEVRDTETAEIAVRAATTGHLVLSTLHTADAVSAVTRLRTLGVPDDHVAATLIGSVGQRLVRRICPGCGGEHRPSDELVRRFWERPPAATLRRGRGCARCGNTGFYGLVGIFELFRPSPELAELIGAGAPLEKLRQAAAQHGYEPLVEDGLRRVLDGTTSLDELARIVAPKFVV